MKAMFSNGLRSARILLAFALVFTAIMAGTYALTRPIVQKNEASALAQQLAQVLPQGYVVDSRPHAQAGRSERYYLARRDDRIAAAIFEATANEGYGGKIRLLIGVAADGTVLGVRVVSHKETPGLGDYIELAKSAWITQFDGKSLANPASERWKVKKDGGDFDYTAGATISPRAIVKAVRATLEDVAARRDTLFAQEVK